MQDTDSPPCLQGMHVRAQSACRVIPVSPGTDGFQEFLRAEFRPVDSCNDITVAPAVTSDDEAAVCKEIHVGFPAAYTSVFFLYEESTFHRLEISRHFKQIQMPFLSSAPIPVIRLCLWSYPTIIDSATRWAAYVPVLRRCTSSMCATTQG